MSDLVLHHGQSNNSVDYPLITSAEEAERLVAQFVETATDLVTSTARCLELLRRIFYGQAWIPLGYASPEELWAARLSHESIRLSFEERTRLATALIASGQDDLPTNMLALGFGVSATTMQRTMKTARDKIRKADSTIRVAQRKAKPLKDDEKARLARIIRLERENPGLGQVAIADMVGASQAVVNRDREFLRAHGGTIPGMTHQEIDELAQSAADAGVGIDPTKVLALQSPARASTVTATQNVATVAIRHWADLAAQADALTAAVNRALDDSVWDSDPWYRADLAELAAAWLPQAIETLVRTARMLGLDAALAVTDGQAGWVDDPRPDAARDRLAAALAAEDNGIGEIAERIGLPAYEVREILNYASTMAHDRIDPPLGVGPGRYE